MLLVQEENLQHKHVINYLSKGIVDPELLYSPVEKFVLVIVHVVH
jgi:hypothetical protein